METLAFILLGFFATAMSFNIAEYTHYVDYLPYQREGLAYFEDFRTSPQPPSSIRNRKMEIGALKLQVEDILNKPVWPSKWPYGFEDFRPLDYSRDQIENTLPRYHYSQSLLVSDTVTIIPPFLKLPIKRHFILPKDKFALAEHMSLDFFDGANVLELYSTYESILPKGFDLGPTVGVGWYEKEMLCNPRLDDAIEQDITMDPYLPLADNYFDFVVVPSMFQLFQRPREMFQEINRVLKPGGVAYIGVKLCFHGFLNWKQGRYYVETNYLEDVLAAGSFFHFADGFSKPESFDLTLPEFNPVGKLKDVLFPQPRMDFYAVVQARKRKDSPHGSLESQKNRDPPGTQPTIEGAKYKPLVVQTPVTKEPKLSPFY